MQLHFDWKAKPTTYCLNKITKFHTLINLFEALIYNLGCFPFDFKPYHLKSVYYLTKKLFGVSKVHSKCFKPGSISE